ncbi:hypothetical protein LTR53_016433, partial [Teratosphaeriaceae sp. CCFEE 6253]
MADALESEEKPGGAYEGAPLGAKRQNTKTSGGRINPSGRAARPTGAIFWHAEGPKSASMDGWRVVDSDEDADSVDDHDSDVTALLSGARNATSTETLAQPASDDEDLLRSAIPTQPDNAAIVEAQASMQTPSPYRSLPDTGHSRPHSSRPATPPASHPREPVTPVNVRKRSRDDELDGACKSGHAPEPKRRAEGESVTPTPLTRFLNGSLSTPSRPLSHHIDASQKPVLLSAPEEQPASMQDIARTIMRVEALLANQQPFLDLIRGLNDRVVALETVANVSNSALGVRIGKVEADARSLRRHVEQSLASFALQWSGQLDEVHRESQ